MMLLSSSLLRLTALLESSPTARVYLRASGGLARLANAAAAAAPKGPDFGETTTQTIGEGGTTIVKANGAGITDFPTASTVRATDPTTACSLPHIMTSEEHVVKASDEGVGGRGMNGEAGTSDRCGDDGVGSRVFGFLLSTLAAALEGGKRLAQQDVMRSGVLDGCAWALQAACTCDVERDTSASTVDIMDTAGAAVLVLQRTTRDLEGRAHVARNASLLSGLFGVIGARSAAPLAVQAAAETLRDIVLGKTAHAAVKTLRSLLPIAGDSSECTVTSRNGKVMNPVGVVGQALQAWNIGAGRMQGASSVDVGEALCGALANLALHEEFRKGFADKIESNPSEGRVGTTAAVLVSTARQSKIGHAEARSLALAALLNACLHAPSVQAETFAAGGFALALAILSLDGEQRTHSVPPMVAARAAGLLARLCACRAALGVVTQPGVIERLTKAMIRNTALGGSIYTAKAVPSEAIYSTDDAVVKSTAAFVERDGLARTLASVLRAITTSPARKHSQSCTEMEELTPAPSSNVSNVNTRINASVTDGLADEEKRGDKHEASEGVEGLMYNVRQIALRQGLGPALIGLLPPAREAGLDGVTRDSVALRPKWSAPPSLTANVCGCLLHLLGGSAPDMAIEQQVVNAGGIPRLISLFANSGGSDALLVRKNAAICLAKLARNPEHKAAIAKLRGMEMLLQSGPSLGV